MRQATAPTGGYLLSTKGRLGRRLIQLYAGLVLYGASSALLVEAGLGRDGAGGDVLELTERDGRPGDGDDERDGGGDGGRADVAAAALAGDDAVGQQVDAVHAASSALVAACS